MIKNIFNQALRRSHYWRDIHFDELSELYTSNMLRSVALSIFMVFVPFYLYEHGYSATAICLTFGSFFTARVMSDIGSGFLVARFGPKHTMIVSCILQIISSAMLLSVPQIHWNPVLLALPWGAAASTFFIAYHVEFSKIKHTTRAGHELGHMQAYEKIGFLIGPIIGGVVGSVFGPQYIFMTAVILLIASLWPLFRSSEPVKTKQKLNFSALPVNKIKRDLFAYACVGVENTLCINAWALYAAVFILTGAVYIQLGLLTAAGVLAAILTAKVIGRVTDTTLARPLMRISTLLNAGTYAIRPFITNAGGVFAVNIVNEAVTTGYRMPFIKGMYSAADDLPGSRIVYISSLEAVASTVKAATWFFLALLATAIALKDVLLISFLIAAVASLGITYERFAVYNRS